MEKSNKSRDHVSDVILEFQKQTKRIFVYKSFFWPGVIFYHLFSSNRKNSKIPDFSVINLKPRFSNIFARSDFNVRSESKRML